MKLLPVERPVYQNLNTSFTSFQGLLDDLASRNLHGYVRLAAQGYEGFLFLTEGVPAGGLDYASGARRMGSPVIKAFGDRAKERGGTLDVFELEAELAGLLAGMGDAEPIYRDLSSDWVVIERLLLAVHEECVEGRVDLRMLDEDGEAVAFFAGGRIVAAMAVSGAESLTSEAAIEFMTQHAQKGRARISVFRAAAQGERGQPLIAASEPAIVPAAPAVRLAAPPVAAIHAAEAEESPVLAAVAAAQSGPDPDAGAAPTAAATTTDDSGKAEVLRSWAGVISAVESVVDEVGRKGQFTSAFREALIENAQAHPFLDPFAQEFSYANGDLRLETVLPPDFGKALSAVLDDTVRRLTFLLRREDLETLVRDRVAGTAGGPQTARPGAGLTALQRAS